MKELNVLYQSSSAYAIPAAVSVCSLFENNKDIDRIKVWFIDVNLTQEDRRGLTKLAERYCREIVFLSGEKVDQMLSEAGVELWSNSYATFYKIFICQELTELEGILYIDADTLILDSLKELCDYDMEGYACAMAGSGMTGTLKTYLGLREYFNAGVIYFNLAYWRQHNMEQAFLDVIYGGDCEKYTMVGDETLNNYVMNGKIKKLSLRFNYESSWWLWGWNHRLYQKLSWESREACYYAEEEIKEAAKKPCIAHYVDLTTGRPWDYLNDNPFRKEFERYLAILNPWKTIDFKMRGMGGDNKIIAWMKCFIKKIMPFSLRSKIGFYQHDKYWSSKIRELQ